MTAKRIGSPLFISEQRRKTTLKTQQGLPRWLSVKEFTCQCRRCRRHRLDPWAGKIPWRRKWLPTAVFLPGEFRGERSLVNYNPWGHEELDTMEQLSTEKLPLLCYFSKASWPTLSWTLLKNNYMCTPIIYVRNFCVPDFLLLGAI